MKQLTYIFFGTDFLLRPDTYWTGTTNLLENFCIKLPTILERNGQYCDPALLTTSKLEREKIMTINFAELGLHIVHCNTCKMFITTTLTMQ